MRFFFNDDCDVTAWDLRRRLDEATQTYVQLSLALTVAMNLPERANGEKLKRLDRDFETKIGGVIRDLSKVYDGKIVLYPTSSDIVIRMENYNAQIEELERVIQKMTGKESFSSNAGERATGKETETMETGKDILDNPCILVCGRHGVGKTSLILASTADEDGAETLVNIPGCTITQTKLFTYIDANDFAPDRETPSEFAARMKETLRMDPIHRNLFDHINQIWYCLDGSAAFPTEAEQEMFQAADCKLILVITKSDLLSGNELARIESAMRPFVHPQRIVFTGNGEDGTFSLEMKKIDAVSETIDTLTTAFEQLMDNLDNIIRTDRENEAIKCIQVHTKRTIDLAVQKKHSVNMAKLIACQMNMVRDIARSYNWKINTQIIEYLFKCIDIRTEDLLAMLHPGEEGVFLSKLMYSMGMMTIRYFQASTQISKEELQQVFQETLRSQSIAGTPENIGDNQL